MMSVTRSQLLTNYLLYIAVRLSYMIAAFKMVRTSKHVVCLQVCWSQFIVHVVKFVIKYIQFSPSDIYIYIYIYIYSWTHHYMFYNAYAQHHMIYNAYPLKHMPIFLPQDMYYIWPNKYRGRNVGCPGSRRHPTFVTGTRHFILSSWRGTLLKMPGT